MTSTATADGRLAAALQEYQAALDAGLPVDRDTFAAGFPDLPDLADDLRALDDLFRAGEELTPGPPTGPALADFDLLREAGRGGMGVVYEARQRSLGRRVAVKVLSRATALDDRTRRRFLHEARAAALVEHPHVVPVFHVGEEHGVPFYVMPFIDGPSLAGRPAAGDWAFVARAGAQAASALAAAHEQGVIHRDVKPANLLLDPAGKVWVADFGLALAPFADGLTQTGGRAGTPRYMSPEQLSGRRDALDARTDVYSLGVTLYELATGRPAFAAADEVELVRAITDAVPPRPRAVDPGIPLDLETVIRKAMARDPADRYPTARALADDLTRFLDGRPVLARRPGPVLTLRRWARRHRRPVLAIGLTLLAGILAGLSASTAVVWRAYQSERQARATAEANRQLAVAAVAELGIGLDDILAHAPGMQDRHAAHLLRGSDRVAPFAGDESLPLKVRWDIAWLNYRLGLVEARRGRAAEAAGHFRTLIDRIMPLGEANPDNPTRPWLIGVAHQQLGHALTALGDRAAARGAYRTGLAHAETALRVQPDWASRIVLAHELRCAAADQDEALAGTPGSSIEVYRDAVTAFEKLRDRYPTGHPLSYMRLATSVGELATRHERLGDWDAAEQCRVKAVGYDEHLARHFAHEPPDVREHTLHQRGELGLLRVRRGRMADGLPDLRRSVVDLERFAELYPTVTSSQSRRLVLGSGLAHAELQAGNAAEARSAAARCADLLAEPNGVSEAEVRARAWALLPFAELRAMAVGERLLAEPAVGGWVRAAVLYRLGRFADAVKFVEKDATTAGRLVRAAALARLGQLDAARPIFARAAEDFAAPPVRDVDVSSFLREVAALVSGIPRP